MSEQQDAARESAMTIGHLLFSFYGRINRAPFWLTSLAMFGVFFVLLVFLFTPAGGNVVARLGDPLSFAVLLVPGILMFWIGLAIGVKRLHDRNKSGAWIVLFWIVPLILLAASGLGGALRLLALPGYAIWIWGTVDMGFLRGTVGANQFGPDPIENRA
jgi:uncharacterized membrane protein YhaH (DUF805 family)